MENRRRAEIISLKRLEVQPAEHELEKLYMWVDLIPLSRPKKNLARDFSDGVMVAELVSHFVPKLVEIHNYPSAFSANQREYNWFTLTKKVFLKVGLDLQPEAIRAIARCVPFVMENFLMILREKLDIYLVRNQMLDIHYEDDIAAVAMMDQQKIGPRSKDSRRRGHMQSGMSDFPMHESPYSPSWLENPDPGAYEKPHYHSEMVPREQLDEKNAMLVEKNKDLEALNAKIAKLENWSELKDRQIEEMNKTVNRLQQDLEYQRQRQKVVQHGPVHLKNRKTGVRNSRDRGLIV